MKLIFFTLFHSGDVNTADFLIKNGATVDTINFSEQIIAGLANKEDMVKWLMGKGVNLNDAHSDAGLTLLHAAAKKGMNVDIVFK